MAFLTSNKHWPQIKIYYQSVGKRLVCFVS